jgi:hypothetical protein
MTSSAPIPGSKVGRARRSSGQLWQVPTFLFGLLALIGVAASAPWRLTALEREGDALLAMLRHGLDRDEPADVLVGLAENIKLRLHQYGPRAAEAHFLVGSAYYRQARQKRAPYAKEIWPLAAEHLEEALSLGGLGTDLDCGQYRLGYALYQQDKDVPRALELMTLGVEKGAEQPLQGYQLLLKCHLQQTPPNLDSALSANRRVLDLTPERDVEAVALARLRQGELLLAKELRLEAIKELERIGAKASQAVKGKARLLQARCYEEEGLWSKAITIWQELLSSGAAIEGGRAQVLYALGQCYQRVDPPRSAETLSVWSEALKIGGQEGQAAGLRLGELHLAQGGSQSALALSDWEAALEKVNSPADFRNPYIEIQEVRDWLKKALRQFQEGPDLQKMNAVAELFRKISPQGGAERELAMAAEASARQLADKLGEKSNTVMAQDVQAQFRRAAEAYERAAQAGPQHERSESLWRSVQCYLAAKEIKRAQELLNQFVKTEQDEARLAEAWYTLGDLYRAQGMTSFAREAYLKCMEFPNTRFAYRSRYFLAIEEIDKKNLVLAREIIRQNLENPPPDIERAWQEKSLFKMASLLMEMKNYGEAHIRLKDCLRLFQENQNALLARELLGQCYLRMAEKEWLKERELDEEMARRKPGMPESDLQSLQESIRHQKNTRINILKQANQTYQQLADELEALAHKKQPSKLEQTLFRRAWLGIGECYLDNEEYLEALRIFNEVQAKHRRTLEGFYASTFIYFVACRMQYQARAKSQMDQVRETAKESVRMLLEDLRALPNEDEIFQGKGARTREAWLSIARASQSQLMAPPKSDGGLPEIR